MPRRRALLAAVVTAVVPALSACSAQVGFGLPTLTTDDAAAVVAAAGADLESAAGSYTAASNGCLLWSQPGAPADGAWIVWPAGSSADDDAVTLLNGSSAEPSDGLDATGALVDFATLPEADDGQSYFGSFGRFCEADERGVLVLTAAQLGEPAG